MTPTTLFSSNLCMLPDSTTTMGGQMPQYAYKPAMTMHTTVNAMSTSLPTSIRVLFNFSRFIGQTIPDV
jgi:hypothetical protein